MRKPLLLTVLLGAAPLLLYACITCDRRIQEGIYNSAFFINGLKILSPFLALGLVVLGLSHLATARHRARITKNPNHFTQTPVPLTLVATILGIGIGGFIDGIFLHQILQWHEMISNQLPPTNYVNKSVNMFWDGIFHAGTLLITIVGILLLWKLLHRPNIDRSGRLLGGGLLLGWGLFNIIEGLLDHHIMKLHNVREITAHVEAWNLAFLGFSVGLLLLGLWLTRYRRAIR